MRKQKRIILWVVILTVLLIIIIFLKALIYNVISPPPSDQAYRVVGVIDGDTFVIGTGESVRLICVDSPEYGEVGYAEAAQYLSELILDKDVLLERDISDTDSYGRLLRYVYVDGIFVNKEVVSSGHAEVFPYEPDTERCEEIGL